MSSSSSSPPPLTIWEHAVFLCFRGEDTREGFTSHLFHELDRSGINTFMDDPLPEGRPISELLDRVEKSRVSVVIFSENFASSEWCLDELVKILECKDRLGQEVLPVFFKVDPSELREPRGKTAKYLAKHQKKFSGEPERIKKWRNAVKQFADLKGWHHEQGRQSGLVSDIVERVQITTGQVSIKVDDLADPFDSMLKHSKPARTAIFVLKTVFFVLWLVFFLWVVDSNAGVLPILVGLPFGQIPQSFLKMYHDNVRKGIKAVASPM